MGMVAGPIPFSAIDRYAGRYGIDGIDAFERFRELIRAMDDEYYRWEKKRDRTKPP